MIMGDFNICEPEEGRLFLRVLEIAQSDFSRRDSTTEDTTRTFSRTDGAFINLWPKARDFHVLENLRKRSVPSDHAAVRVVFSKKPTIRVHQGKRISELDVQMTITSTLLTSSSSEKQEGGLFASSHVRHMTAWEPSC